MQQQQQIVGGANNTSNSSLSLGRTTLTGMDGRPFTVFVEPDDDPDNSLGEKLFIPDSELANMDLNDNNNLELDIGDEHVELHQQQDGAWVPVDPEVDGTDANVHSVNMIEIEDLRVDELNDHSPEGQVISQPVWFNGEPVGMMDPAGNLQFRANPFENTDDGLSVVMQDGQLQIMLTEEVPQDLSEQSWPLDSENNGFQLSNDNWDEINFYTLLAQAQADDDNDLQLVRDAQTGQILGAMGQDADGTIFVIPMPGSEQSQETQVFEGDYIDNGDGEWLRYNIWSLQLDADGQMVDVNGNPMNGDDIAALDLTDDQGLIVYQSWSNMGSVGNGQNNIAGRIVDGEYYPYDTETESFWDTPLPGALDNNQPDNRVVNSLLEAASHYPSFDDFTHSPSALLGGQDVLDQIPESLVSHHQGQTQISVDEDTYIAIDDTTGNLSLTIDGVTTVLPADFSLFYNSYTGQFCISKAGDDEAQVTQNISDYAIFITPEDNDNPSSITFIWEGNNFDDPSQAEVSMTITASAEGDGVDISLSSIGSDDDINLSNVGISFDSNGLLNTTAAENEQQNQSIESMKDIILDEVNRLATREHQAELEDMGYDASHFIYDVTTQSYLYQFENDAGEVTSYPQSDWLELFSLYGKEARDTYFYEYEFNSPYQPDAPDINLDIVSSMNDFAVMLAITQGSLLPQQDDYNDYLGYNNAASIYSGVAEYVDKFNSRNHIVS